MDWTQWLVLGLGAGMAVAAPLLLVKAIRRREPHRVYEILLMATALGVMVARELAPTLLPGLGVPGRVLMVLLFILFIAHLFGLSRWLLTRGK